MTSPGVARADNHHLINLSLFYPASTNQDPEISTNFRLSLIQGRAGEVRGVDLNLIVAMLSRDMRGLQFSGVYSQVYGDVRGLQFTGAVNFVKGDVSGGQWAFGVNFNNGRVRGLQYGGLFNFNYGGFSGGQLSTFVNQNDAHSRWVQVAGVANANTDNFDGVMLSALVNFVADDVRGVQVSGFNVAGGVRGVQAGILNASRDMRGLQVGIINFSDEMHGLPLGLVNIEESDGEADWISYASNLSGLNTGVRTIVNNWYSWLTVGVGDVPNDVSETAFVSWNFGRRYSLSSKFNLGADLGFTTAVVRPEDGSNYPVLQLRGVAEFRTSPKFSMFAGLGVSSIGSSYDEGATTKSEGLVFLGISAF